MYLTQSQVDGQREVRINLYFQDGHAILEVRTLQNLYTYRIHAVNDTPQPEAIHCAWLDVSNMLPFYAEDSEDLEQHVFNSLWPSNGERPHYRLERISARPLVAPLPVKPETSKRNRRR